MALSLLTAMCLGVIPAEFITPSVQAQTIIERIQSLFTRRRAEGNASGRRRGGAIRDQCNTTQATDKPLTALIPANNLGLTTTDYPTFWFYLPFGRSAENLSAQFMLLDENDFPVLTNDRPITIALPETSGIVGFQLPETEQPLEVDHSYRWHLTLVCHASFGSMDLTEVNGWIRRVEPSSDLTQQLDATPPEDHYIPYASYSIWYDALTQLAENKTTYAEDWEQLLRLFELQDLANLPITELNAAGLGERD